MARLDARLVLGRGGDRFVAWAIAMQVFFATLALGGILALDEAEERWRSGDYAVVTVALPADSAPEVRTAALEAMRQTPGVLRAELVSPEGTAALLAPWLRGLDLPEDLPLPVLIDVGIQPDRSMDWPAAERRLLAAAPDALLDTGMTWVERLIDLARALQALIAVVLAVVAVVAALTVAFATRAGFAASRDAIEIVHWLGARDREVARAFQRRALWLGACGGILGASAALAVMFLLGHAGRELDAPILQDLALPLADWPILAAAPLAGVVVAVLTARGTALKSLARMP